jgi:dihydrofolate reductase
MTSNSGRRLRQSALVSLNGVAGTPLAWAGPYFGGGSVRRSLTVLEQCGAFLMGRRTYEIFARQWPDAPGEYAAALNAFPKFVFSSTLERADWNNTTIVRDEPATAVAALKAEAGADLLMYGHGRLGHTLVNAGLVDELTLNVVPVFVDGEPFFRPDPRERTWELVAAGRGSDPGLASLTYRFVA